MHGFDSKEPTVLEGNAHAVFRGRTVLLVSPQPWEHQAVSKHHYANELTLAGARVYFVGPPSDLRLGQIEVEPVQEHLWVVRHALPVSARLRFHARSFFDWAVRPHIRRLGRIGGSDKPDLVWCFEPNLYRNLQDFGARKALFHAADPFTTPFHASVAASSDLIVSVSDRILELYEHAGIPRALVNHGLSRPFEELARQPLKTRTAGVLRVGYAGNLTSSSLNIPVLRQMVEAHPEVAFHFWGDANGSTHVEGASDFLLYLKAAPHVRLHGSVGSGMLARALQEMDVLLLSYTLSPSYDKSNSHKLLEYLSTGKVVVSSQLSQYSEASETLFVQSHDAADATLPGLFSEVLGRIEHYNAPAYQEARRTFALNHTYARQLDRIALLVSSSCGRNEF